MLTIERVKRIPNRNFALVTGIITGRLCTTLQDELAQVFILSHFVEPLGDIGGVDDDAAGFHVGRLETELFEQAFHDRVETPRADVLRRLVDPVCIIGKRLDGVGLEGQLDPSV